MISCSKGVVQLEGTGSQLLAELGSIMRGMICEGIANKNLLYEAVEYACMSDDELHKQAENMTKELLGEMFLDMLLSDIMEMQDKNNPEESGKRTKQAQDMLNIIKEVKRRKK